MTATQNSDLMSPDPLGHLFRDARSVEQRSPTDLRPIVVKILKDALRQAHIIAEKQLLADGNGTACAQFLSDTQDRLVQELFQFANGEIFPAEKSQGQISIVAVGGYGRGTLAPGSDIDLLFVLPSRQTNRTKNIVEFILYCLWDARQKVGHATRSIDECIRLAKSDNTILTAILEARFICGDQELFQRLVTEFRRDLLSRDSKKFIADKLAERDVRHMKAGETRYLVEPDVKDGKGGLRDLNTLFWIAKYMYAADSTDQLAQKGAFSRDELAVFKKCERFLWAVRCHLHFLSRRGEDRLSFDRQPDIAERLGYKARAGLKHVERFMKHYFLIAKDVGDLTRIFCASLEAKHVKDVPAIGRMIGRLVSRTSGVIEKAPDFKIESGRIVPLVDDVFNRDPVNIIRLFTAAGQTGAEIHPDTLKLLRKSLGAIRTILNNAEANALFLGLLTSSEDPDIVLRMMNEAGVLGRFIPPFGRIVAMMQFNMYHHYTVDEHLIRAVGQLSAIERGRLADDHPLSTAIFPTLMSRRLLYVAVFLHDIAKGRKEDHSIGGERIALDLCPRLGLTPPETETVAWLIRHHLLMSETSQMRDLNDFKTILDFCAVVQSLERLKLLIILTVADIRAVGPGVWNGWKGQLLRTLYAEAEPVLTGGHTAVSRRDRIVAAQTAFFSRHDDWREDQKVSYAARHYDAYWLGTSTDEQMRHATLISQASPRSIVTSLETDAFTAITELTIYAPDHPRLLALITGACAAAGANIAGAQIFTTTDGMALDTILIQREFQDENDERRRGERIAELVRKALRGELRLKEAVSRAYRPQQRIKAFQVEPRVIIDNQSSNRFTVIEINGLDRLGLLYELTEALYTLNINIASAHITTFGEKAVDVFYVTDLTGAKIESAARHKHIENALLDILRPAQAAVAGV